MAKTFPQLIYGLFDPIEPNLIRYVGRTNKPELRLRTHVGDAGCAFTIKDVWLMYLRYAGREPTMSIIEDSQFNDSMKAERWVKDRERHWIKRFSEDGAELLNNPNWSIHPTRKAIPRGVKKAWCESHVLYWAIDRSWEVELPLLTYLKKQYGVISRSTPQPNGAVLCETMGEISLCRSQYEGRRFRAYSVLRALLDAYPALAVGDIQTILDYQVPSPS